MSRDDLFNAMKYGSDREYTSADLGRFGLGLKSASLSQCRILTVVSKNDSEISAFQWNLDSVIQDKKWDCIELESDELIEVPSFKQLSAMQMGTLVVWQNFDIAYKKNNIIIVCPNHHRMLHKLNPVFNRENSCFTVDDKTITIALDYHLK